MFIPTRTLGPGRRDLARLAGPLLMVLAGFCACGGYTRPTLAGPTIARFTAARDLISAGDGTTLSADFSNGLGLIDQGVGPVSASLPVPVNPLLTTTYTLTAGDAGGARAESSLTVRVVPVPALPVIQPPASVEPGKSGLTASVAAQAGCTYLWTLNAKGGVITSGAQGPAVTFDTAPFGELTLFCTVSNAAGYAVRSPKLTFPLGGPTVEAFAAEPAVITAGDSTVLTFTFSGGAGVVSAAGSVDIPLASTDVSLDVTPAATTTYLLTVTDSQGRTTDSGGVTVTVVPAPVVSGFSASPGIIGTGAVTQLFAAFAAGPGGSAVVDEGIGPVRDQMAVATGTLEHSTTFTLTVTNAAGKAAPPVQCRVLVGSLARLAGTPTGEGSSDGTQARYLGPAGVIGDAAGNRLVADTGNHTIRRIDPAGMVITLAGKEGLAGSADGVGAAARFNAPAGLALDPANGDLLVADSGNHTVRRVTPAGLVSTLAGSAGVAGHADGAGLAASFDHPTGLAVGNQVLFVADTGNATIREVRLAGAEVTTLSGVAGAAGNQDGDASTARFGAPAGLAWREDSGRLYVADAGNNSIRAVTLLDGSVRTVAGDLAGAPGATDGTGNGARFDHPQGLVLDDPNRLLYVADTGNSTLRAVALDDLSVSLVAGAAGNPGSTDAPARFDLPRGIALDAGGGLLLADTGNATLRAVTPDGLARTLSGKPGLEGHLDGAAGTLRMPRGAALDPASGVLYVADQGNQLIRTVHPDGTVATLAGAAGLAGSADGGAAARFHLPVAVALDRGNLIVADQGNHTIRSIAPDGTVRTLAGAAGDAGAADSTGAGPAGARFNLPAGVAVDALGTVYVADQGNHAIRRILPDGTVSTLSAAFSAPEGLALAGATLYVADPGDHTVRTLSNGQVALLAGKPGVPGSAGGTGTNARLDRPTAIALDAAGRLLVTCAGDSTVRLISPEGSVRTVIGDPAQSGNAAGPLPARISQPYGIAVDRASGNIFVTIDDALMKVDFTQ